MKREYLRLILVITKTGLDCHHAFAELHNTKYACITYLTFSVFVLFSLWMKWNLYKRSRSLPLEQQHRHDRRITGLYDDVRRSFSCHQRNGGRM